MLASIFLKSALVAKDMILYRQYKIYGESAILPIFFSPKEAAVLGYISVTPY
jgi:hypothetical protein